MNNNEETPESQESQESDAKPQGPEYMIRQDLPKPPAPLVVVGIVVSATGPHEHDGRHYARGEAFMLPPGEPASDLIRQGAVNFIKKEEKPHDSEND